MIFHFGYELPVKVSTELNHESQDLTSEEIKILRKQIRQNSVLIDQYVDRLELFVNKERYPPKAVFLQKIRRRLELLMEENDTFRNVLWRHYQRQEIIKETSYGRQCNGSDSRRRTG